jgi:hypothetical protein
MKTQQNWKLYAVLVLALLLVVALAACGGDQVEPVTYAPTTEPTSTVEEVNPSAEEREVVHEPLETPEVPDEDAEVEPVVLESSPFTECVRAGEETSLHYIGQTPWIVYYVHRSITQTIEGNTYHQFLYYVEAQSSELVEDDDSDGVELYAQFTEDLEHQNRSVDDAIATWMCPSKETAVELAEERARIACDDIIWNPGSRYALQSELLHYVGSERQDTTWCRP